MNKSVLLSIKPKYCELIVSGKKTVEIRKNHPKIDVPFKVYMYCTKNGLKIYGDGKSYVTDNSNILNEETKKGFEKTSGMRKWNGKVIGEFVCDDITSYRMCMGVPEHLVREGAISFDEIWKYCNKGENDLYAWHISGLVIYDEPKELSEFRRCKYTAIGNEYSILTRPPQSWCYVEELAV